MLKYFETKCYVNVCYGNWKGDESFLGFASTTTINNINYPLIITFVKYHFDIVVFGFIVRQ
jgi:hypothetical protein